MRRWQSGQPTPSLVSPWSALGALWIFLGIPNRPFLAEPWRVMLERTNCGLDWMTLDPLGPDEVKACLASVMFILTNAAKHGVAADTLSQELQQLGLPKGTLQSYCVALVQCQD
jgi:hypothetical protein